MQTLSFATLCLAADAMKREVDSLERLAADHNALRSYGVAAHFAKEAARIERARAEIHAAMGGAL